MPQLCIASLFEWTRRWKCAAPGYMSGYNSDSDHVNPVYLITFFQFVLLKRAYLRSTKEFNFELFVLQRNAVATNYLL